MCFSFFVTSNFPYLDKIKLRSRYFLSYHNMLSLAVVNDQRVYLHCVKWLSILIRRKQQRNKKKEEKNARGKKGKMQNRNKRFFDEKHHIKRNKTLLYFYLIVLLSNFSVGVFSSLFLSIFLFLLFYFPPPYFSFLFLSLQLDLSFPVWNQALRSSTVSFARSLFLTRAGRFQLTK